MPHMGVPIVMLNLEDTRPRTSVLTLRPTDDEVRIGNTLSHPNWPLSVGSTPQPIRLWPTCGEVVVMEASKCSVTVDGLPTPRSNPVKG